MISDTLHRIIEHFPDHARSIPFLVAATRFSDDDGPSFRIDTKTLITAVVVALVTGVAGAAWATYSTTKELGIQFSYLSKQIEATAQKVERHNEIAVEERAKFLERLAKMETMMGVSGQEGRRKNGN